MSSGGTTTVEGIVTVRNKSGLHARPSSVLAETALRFKETAIVIRKGDLEVDAKSILELLQLQAACGAELTIIASGPRADEALETLRQLFERQFDVKL